MDQPHPHLFPLLPRLAGLLLGLGLAAGASAEIEVYVAAQADKAWSDGLFFDPPLLRASGHASASSIGSSGGIGPGLLGCSTLLCGPSAQTPGAHAAVNVDAERGRIGVLAFAWGKAGDFDAEASAVGRIVDTLDIPAGPPLMFRLRVELGFDASQADDTEARYDFAVTLRRSSDESITFFAFGASEVGDGSGSTLRQAWIAGTGLGPGGAGPLDPIPGVFEIALPLQLDPGQYRLEIYGHAHAEADDDGGPASVDSLFSGYLGIDGDYHSWSGYDYAGYSAPVPEPAGLALWVLGGLGLALRLSRRRA